MLTQPSDEAIGGATSAKSPPPTPAPGPVERSLVRGLDALRAGDEVLAYHLFRRAVQEEPENDDAWFWRGITSSDIDEMVQCLGQAVALNPANLRARDDLIWAQQHRRKADTALVRPGLSSRQDDEEVAEAVVDAMPLPVVIQRAPVVCVGCGGAIPPDVWVCPQCAMYRVISETGGLDLPLPDEPPADGLDDAASLSPAPPARWSAHLLLGSLLSLTPAGVRRLTAGLSALSGVALLFAGWTASALPAPTGTLLHGRWPLPEPLLSLVRQMWASSAIATGGLARPSLALVWSVPFVELRVGELVALCVVAGVAALVLATRWWRLASRADEA
jgi:hypothetical protein